jgi:hypothetical protein
VWQQDVVLKQLRGGDHWRQQQQQQQHPSIQASDRWQME